MFVQEDLKHFLGVALLTGCSAEPKAVAEVENIDVAEITLDAYTSFNEVDNVLIYTANTAERQGVIVTLKDKNKRRRAKFKIKNRGSHYKIDNFKVRQGDGRIDDVDIYIVEEGNEIPRVSGGYDAIALRGHTGDMLRMGRKTRDFEADHVTYLLGGCNSYPFVDDFMATRAGRVAVFADTNVGESAMNTYLLIKFLDESQKHDTWRSLSSKLKGFSSKVASDFYCPGDEGN